jgi:hypothetical protein
MNQARRPSAATVIACVALFAALSGGAIAAKSSIDSKDIENNSITSKDVKKDSLKGSDVKKNSLKGSDINESKLGEVPSAANAANATNADGLAGLAAVRVAPFTLTDGQEQQIYQRGAFSLTATCTINDGGDDFARILIATTVNDSSFDAEDTTEDLDTNTLADDREFLVAEPLTTEPEMDSNSDGSAFAPDGSEITGADLTAAVNLVQDGPGVCRFYGMVLGV